MRDLKPGDIVTHNGLFHADEVFAIAMLQLGGVNGDIIRTRDAGVLNIAVDRQDVYTVDVGGHDNALMNNYDHHQASYKGRLASAGLIWSYAKTSLCENEDAANWVYNNVIQAIDLYDMNLDDVRNSAWLKGSPFIHLSQVIKTYNYTDVNSEHQYSSFLKAIDFAKHILSSKIAHANKLFTDKIQEAWNGAKRETLTTGTEVIIFDKFFPYMEDMMAYTGEEYHWVLNPSYNQDGSWAVKSFDTNAHPLPFQKDVMGCRFVHNNKFFAAFESKEDVMANIHHWDMANECQDPVTD